MEYSDVAVSMTEIFEEVNRLHDKRKPAVRETFAAINRPGNPVMKEMFTQTTPDNKAHLSSPLTLKKCLTFERGMLDFQQKCNVERYTNYADTDLKYETKAKFGLTGSDFNELSQDLHRCLSEMIVSLIKSDQDILPTSLLGTFLVSKEKLIRAIEFLLTQTQHYSL